MLGPEFEYGGDVWCPEFQNTTYLRVYQGQAFCAQCGACNDPLHTRIEDDIKG